MDLGVIPDGNRRYAEQNSISKIRSYRKAKEKILTIFDDLSENNSFKVESITFYLLSEENLKRPDNELEELFDLLRESVSKLAEKFNDNGYSFNWCTTNPSAIPKDLREQLKDLEEKHSNGEKTVNALISYSGKKDVLQAAKDSEKISEENLENNLEIQNNIDFVIRSGDNPERECISGFPVWNSSYAEFYHVKKNFPEITTSDIENALNHYQKLRRKKGE